MIQGASRYHVELTNDEKALLDQIDLELDTDRYRDFHAVYLANQRPILALLKSIGDRGAIPQARLKYWTDPNYHSGRLKTSRKGVFKRNGNRGDEIYLHPGFLKYLRYFLFGANLPESVIKSFEDKVGNPEWVTSGDVVPIGRHARQLMRDYHLPYEAPEEFLKLALDIGLSLSVASAIESSAKQGRRR